jgi:hypothetical protein
MADTAIEIPGYVTIIEPTPRKSVQQLARHVGDLLTEHHDLPAPVYFSVSQAGQEACFQFADCADSFRAMAQWAERFGGTVTGEPHTRDDGRSSIHCQVKFTDHGVSVELYAFITTAQAGKAT